MTKANSGWFSSIKSRAASVGKSAKVRLDQLTETIDKKLKEAEDDLERQRLRAEATESAISRQNIWRPSSDNPNGEIIPVVAPPPSTTMPVNQATTTDSKEESSLQTPPPIIRHRKLKRHHLKQNDPESDSGNEHKIEQKKLEVNQEHELSCINQKQDNIINLEIVKQCLNDLIDVISIANDLVEHVSLNTTMETEGAASEQVLVNSAAHDKSNLNTVESISSSSNSDGDNIQEVIHFSEQHSESNPSEPSPSEPNNNEPNPTEPNYNELNHNEPSHKEPNNNEPNPTELNHNELNHNEPSHKEPNNNEPNHTEPIIEENEGVLPSNELEDSFNEFLLSNASSKKSYEKTSAKPTDLSELRQFLSSIKYDDDSHHDELPLAEQTNSRTPEKVEKLSNQMHELNHMHDSLISFSKLIPDDMQNEELVNTSRRFNSISNSTMSKISEEDIIKDSTMSLVESVEIEKEQFSTVNDYTIPPGSTINQIQCSSSYIYICTSEQKIFYAKLSNDNMNLPLKWMQSSDLADQLAVSNSNRTVWRLLHKRLYVSKDPQRLPPLGSSWHEITMGQGQSVLSMSVTDECGWYIKENGTLWLLKPNDQTYKPLNVACAFNLNRVCCLPENVAVSTNDGEILIRAKCTNDCPEGNGWIFVDHNFGPIHDFALLTNHEIIFIMDKRQRLWVHQCSQHFICVNSQFLCITDCRKRIQMFSQCVTAVQWELIEETTRLQRLIGIFSNENSVWALTTERMIRSSSGEIIEKPLQAQYITHASFVPDTDSRGTPIWSLDESCNIYIRSNLEKIQEWEQLDQSQFAWHRRLIHIACSSVGVWAVDDQGCVYFRHGHAAASEHIYGDEISLLPPAWILIPGLSRRFRSFSQIYCGPADWMVYTTDNKQNVYVRTGINEENLIGTSWNAIDDCSALELAISEHTLWLLTSRGQIQCRENISRENPVGTRSTTLSGLFLSIAVSVDDSQVWALDSKRNLLKLDRLAVSFEK